MSKAILTAAGGTVQAELARGKHRLKKNYTHTSKRFSSMHITIITLSIYLVHYHNPTSCTKIYAVLCVYTLVFLLCVLKVGIPADCMCTTGPGMLACREIIHASFRCDPQLIRKNCKKILKQCESKGYRSVAFPAINTGLYCVYMDACVCVCL